MCGALAGAGVFSPSEISAIDRKSRLSLDACCDRFGEAALELIANDRREAAAFAAAVQDL